MFNRFDTVSACADGQTDIQTDVQPISITCFSIADARKNEKIRVTLCKNATGALYIVNKMCVDGRRNVQGETS